MANVAFATLGCRVNQYETEAMMELFKRAGYEIMDFDDCADVYVINTCTVTSFGDKKSRQMIRRARKRNGGAIIAVVGCYSQVSPDAVRRIPGVDIVLGTSDRANIINLVEQYRQSGVPIDDVRDIAAVREFEELVIDGYRGRTRAFLKIQDGCDRYCSYCLIPYARGPIRSRDPEKVIEQAKRLADSGFREITLSGIHVASYGKDLSGVGLVDIIESIEQIGGIERIRIGSVEPTFFTDEVVGRLKRVSKLCRHFHMSLQSGCDETLRRMNRHYTTDEYESIVNMLRDAIPGVSVTTDIIVGFPGESEEEFDRTYGYLKRLKLSKTHVFKYSPRRGTAASRFKDQVSPEEKERRSSLLLELSRRNERRFIGKFIGSGLNVLYEQEAGDGFIEGYTDNYISVRAGGDASLIGGIYRTTLTENRGEFALGSIYRNKKVL